MATTVSSLVVEVGSNITGLTRGLNTADKNIGNFASKVGTRMREIGSSVTGLGTSISALTAPIGLALGAGISIASAFEDSMAELSARTGLVGEDLQDVTDFALEMGAKTAFSAQQAADGMLELTAGGMSAQDAMKALPGIMDAAAASGMELGQTADTITNIMSAFGLVDPGDAQMVADALVKAAGASSADFSGLAEGFANVGSIAGQYGLGIDETAAALAVFADNGIKGAEAGTQLKSMLLKLGSPEAAKALKELGTSLYDNQGNVRDFDTLIDDLGESLGKLPVSEQNRLMGELAGSYGIVGLSALIGAGGIDTMEGKMTAASDAASVGQSKMNTFSGKVDALSGSVETLAIKRLTPLMENVLTPMAEKLTDVVNGVIKWTDENPELSNQLVGIAAAALLVGPGLVIAGIGISSAGVALSALGAGIALVTSPLFLAAAGFVALGAGLAYVWTQDVGGIRTKIEEIGTALTNADVGGAATTLKDNIESQINSAFTQLEIDAISLKDRIVSQIESAALEVYFDANTLKTNTETQINTAFTQLEIDATGVQDQITGLFTDVTNIDIDLSGIQTWAQNNMDAILNTVMGVAGIVFGGPIGMTIGAARLVSTAIDQDFLGIGTYLKESGISSSLEAAFYDLKNDVNGILENVFSGGGGTDQALSEAFAMGAVQAPSAKGGPLATFVDDLKMGLDWLGNELPKITGPITDGLSALGTGIGGFIDNLTGTETGGLLRIATTVGGAVGAIVTKLAEVGASIVGEALTNIGAALPQIGSFINDFVSALSRLGEGDFAGMAQRLGEGVVSLVDAGLNLIGLDFDPIITTVTGLWDSVSDGIDAFKTGISDAFAWIKTNVIDPIVEAINGIKTSLDGLTSGLGAYGGAADNLGAALNSGASPGDFLGALAKAIGDEINPPGAASGANVVSAGLVYAHAGERILNRAETQDYESGGRGGRGSGGNVIQIQGVTDIENIMNELRRRGIYLDEFARR